jgi:hypothetical protein
MAINEASDAGADIEVTEEAQAKYEPGHTESYQTQHAAPPNATAHSAVPDSSTLIAAFKALTGHSFPLDAHGRRALELFQFIVPAAKKNATRFHVERIRILHSDMRQAVRGEQSSRLAAQIEAAALAYHSSNEADVQDRAVESVISMLLLLAGQERDAEAAKASDARDRVLRSRAARSGEQRRPQDVMKGPEWPDRDIRAANDTCGIDDIARDELIEIPTDSAAIVRAVLARLSPSRNVRGRKAYGIGHAAQTLASAFGVRALTSAAYNISLKVRSNQNR